MDLSGDPVIRDWFREARSDDERTRDAAFARFATLGEQQGEICRLLLSAEAEEASLPCSPSAAFEWFFDRAREVLDRLRRDFPQAVQTAKQSSGPE